MGILNSIKRRGTMGKPKGIIYGAPKVGKTTFAGCADGALIVDCEGGADTIPAARTPKLESWPDVLAALRELSSEENEYTTIVIDSLDWLMRLIEEHVTQSKSNPTATLFKSHGGYGNGRKVMENIIRQDLIPALDALNHDGKTILLIAHSTKAEVLDGDGMPVNKVAPDLAGKWLDTFVQWSDFIGYMRKRGEQRVLCMSESESYIAGNRYGLSGECPIPEKPMNAGYAMLEKAITSAMQSRMSETMKGSE